MQRPSLMGCLPRFSSVELMMQRGLLGPPMEADVPAQRRLSEFKLCCAIRPGRLRRLVGPQHHAVSFDSQAGVLQAHRAVDGVAAGFVVKAECRSGFTCFRAACADFDIGNGFHRLALVDVPRRFCRRRPRYDCFTSIVIHRNQTCCHPEFGFSERRTPVFRPTPAPRDAAGITRRSRAPNSYVQCKRSFIRRLTDSG